MKIKDTYYKKLVEGYLNKSLTKREMVVFLDLLSKGELDFYVEEDMVAHYPKENNKTMVRPNKPWFWLAASLVLLCGLSVIYRSFSVDHPTPQERVEDNKIFPGGNHAVLTLADGQELVLDGDSSKSTLFVNNIKISTIAQGVVVYDLSKYNSSDLTRMDIAKQWNSLKTPKGGTYQIVLADGTKVWLNSESLIRFPVVFDSKERVVETVGEVFLEVTKSDKHPFIVKTRGQEVRVLGTSFNINAYPDEPYVRTTLITGKINLRTKEQLFELSPGEEILNYENHVKVQKADIEQAMAWKEGNFRFDKVDVHTLMRQIGRWYNVNIKINGNFDQDRFVGKISRMEHLDKVLFILKEGGLNVALVGDTVVLSK